MDIEFVPGKNMIYVVDFFGETVWYVSTEFLQIRDVAEKYDAFGGATSNFRSDTLATGDFNKDGYRDLAIGLPGEDIKIGEVNIKDAGIINIIYGSATGLRSIDNQIWYQGIHQGNHQIMDSPESYDRFGSGLATGDFNRDGCSDLAIGVPEEDIVNQENAGVINVIYGFSLGLTATNNQIWYQGNNRILETAEKNDNFGSALAAGNFGHGNADDLAIGVPGEDFVNKDVGVINVIYGSSSGLSDLGLTATNNQIWHQGNNGILETAEKNDNFGWTLAAGNFGHSNVDDFVIGVPGEDIVNKGIIGIINVIYGTEYGLKSTNNQIWYPGNNGILEPPNLEMVDLVRLLLQVILVRVMLMI